MALVRPAKPLEDPSGLHLLTLDVLVLRKLGAQALAWDSPVLLYELQQAFGAVGPLTWERIQAARCMHIQSAFWVDWEVFEKCSLVTCGRIPDFEHVQPLEAEDLAIAVHTAARIDSHEYSEDVRRYIAASCLNDGAWYVEDPLKPLIGTLVDEYLLGRGSPVHPAEVAKCLETQDKVIVGSEDAVVVQANRVLSIREALARYDAEVAEQMQRLPALLGESR